MKTILLTQGKFALVDDEDYESLLQFNWCAAKTGRRVYAVTRVRGVGGKWTTLSMHRFLLPDSKEVDHRNGDGLDNRRKNIRAATGQENQRGFKRKKIGASSQFRGVHWHKGGNKWQALIKISEKRSHLGLFVDEEDAARAYDAAAKKFFGEFANLNFLV